MNRLTAGQVATDGRRIIFPSLRFSVSFQRTLRIPDDGKTYPLPPGLGHFPIRAIDMQDRRIPAEMRRRGGFVIPMYQREALWMLFDGESRAVQIAAGAVNAISGGNWHEPPAKDPQNYLVVPDQPWLDGINAGEGFVRQFVAVPLGVGYSVEEQVTGAAEFGGIQIRVMRPKAGIVLPKQTRLSGVWCCECSEVLSMGLGAGGKMRQQIDRDPYGFEVWDAANALESFIHIVNSESWTAITGEPMPGTPVSPKTYTEHGFPWFDLYREGIPSVGASDRLGQVKTVKEVDSAKGLQSPPGDETVSIPEGQVLTLGCPGWPKP